MLIISLISRVLFMQPLLHGDDDQIADVSGCRFFQLTDHQWNAWSLFGSVEVVVADGFAVVFDGALLGTSCGVLPHKQR